MDGEPTNFYTLRSRAYRATPKGKAADARYNLSPKGKAAKARYSQSPQGKAAEERARNAVQTRADRRLTALWRSARARALKKGRPIDVAAKPAILPSICPLTGLEISLSRPRKGKQGPRRPSLDQIVPGAGYIPGNVRVVSVWANKAKAELTDDEFIAFCAAVCMKANLDGRSIDPPIRLLHALRKMSVQLSLLK